MEFGRGQKIDNVNFALPADAVMTDRVLQSARGRDEPLRLWVGGTGWGQAKWVGKVYPRGTRPKDFLSHYVRQFNSIELNALWYNLQPKAVIGKWASLAGPGFRFCPKFSNTISHERLLEGADRDTGLFIDHMSSFGVSLGSSFLQLPESFGPSRAKVLHAYLLGLPRSFRVCVELRHEGWFGTAAVRETWELMFELGIGAVITDTPGRRDVLHMRLTAPVAFIRWVGNNLHPTDFRRIDEWGERLRTWVDKGLREVYFFIHDHEELYSPELARYAVEVFNSKLGTDFRPPHLIGEEPPAKDLTLF
jgi:uncharacterized protein YecE (DUF72 family)